MAKTFVSVSDVQALLCWLVLQHGNRHTRLLETRPQAFNYVRIILLIEMKKLKNTYHYKHISTFPVGILQMAEESTFLL